MTKSKNNIKVKKPKEEIKEESSITEKMKKGKETVKNQEKPLNPYNQFVKEELPKIKAQHPNITPNDAFKEAAERWKVSPNNPKNKTDNKENIKVNNNSNNKSSDINNKKNEIVKSPKNSLPPYNQFVKDEYPKIKAEHPNILPNDVFKEAAERWKTSPSNPKNKTDKQDNTNENINFGTDDVINNNENVQNSKKALPLYNQFVKEELPKIIAEKPNITSRDAFKEVAERWNVSPNNPKNKTEKQDKSKENTKRKSTNSDNNDKKKENTQNTNKTITPYNQFVKEEIPKIQAEKPNITSRDALKEAAERWKVSPENPKNKTNKQDNKENININNNNPSNTSNSDVITKKNDKNKNQKKALTPYNQFVKQEIPKIKAEQPNITPNEALKEAAERWKVSPENPKNK